MYCFSQFCRLCVRKDQNLVNLFCPDEDLIMYSEKIQSVIPEITFNDDDNIPNFICYDCRNNVKNLYKFRKKCLKNDAILKLFSKKLTIDKQDNLETELNLLRESLRYQECDIDFSLIFIKKKSNEISKKPINKTVSFKCETKETETESATKDEKLLEDTNQNSVYQKSNSDQKDTTESDTESQNNLSMHSKSEEEHDVIKYSRNGQKRGKIVESDLNLGCTEDEESIAEDNVYEEQGNESMDCEIISVNDSELDRNNDDTMDQEYVNDVEMSQSERNSEPVNLTSKIENIPGTSTSLNKIKTNISPRVFCINPEMKTSCKTRTNDKYRVVYTEHQRLELEKEFLLDHFIADKRRAELAETLGLTVRQIKIWFQNRRAKERKETKRSDNSENISSPNSNTSQSITSTPDRRSSIEITPIRNQNFENNPQFLLQQEEIIKQQQEFYISQQILQKHQEFLLHEQLLKQKKEFVNQHKKILKKEYHHQLIPYQQEITQLEELIKQQNQFFNQHQQLIRQQNNPAVALLQHAMLINQLPLLLNQQKNPFNNFLSNSDTKPATSNSRQSLNTTNDHQLLPQSTEIIELIKVKDEPRKQQTINNKLTITNNKEIEEQQKRKQELTKIKEERPMKIRK